MAKYGDIVLGLPVGAGLPPGFTSRFTTSGVTIGVTDDVDSPSGKAINIRGASTARTFFSYNAINADPDRATVTQISLIRINNPHDGGAATTFGGLASRGSGSAGSETVNVSAFNRGSNITGERGRISKIKYTAGSATVLYASPGEAWVQNGIYWLKQVTSGTTYTSTLYAANDLNGTPLTSGTETANASNANNWIGIFKFSGEADFDVLFYAIGTGADLPDPPGGVTPTLSAATGTETSDTTADGSVTTDTTGTSISAVVTASATPPSRADIIAGTGAVYAVTPAVTVIGAQSFSATGLTAETTYYWHFVQGENSNIITSNAFTTEAVPVSPPATAPANLTPIAISDTEITSTWESVAGATGYDLEVDSVATDVGNVLTADTAGLTELTGYDFRVRAYNAAGDGPWSAVVSETTDAAPAEIVLVTDFDSGNVSQTLTTITNPASAEPIINVLSRPAAITGTNGSGWTITHFAVENAEGVRPVISLDRDDMAFKFDTPLSTYLPSWTQDFINYTQAPSRSLIGGATGTIEFQFTDPFPAGRVYIVTNPLGQQAAAAPYAASLLADYPGIVSPTGSADSGGVYFTSPAEVDENGRQCGGHDMFALKFEFGGSTTDGGPKRKALITYGQHAMGEAQAWWAFKSFVDYILDSTDAEAVRDRANFDYYVYFNISPNGIFSGHRRHNPSRSTDPNRDWVTTPVLAEIAATKNAIVADTAGAVDVVFDWHGASSRSDNFLVYAPIQANTARFIELGEIVFGSTGIYDESDQDGTLAKWALINLGATFTTAAETHGRGDTSLSNYQNIGVNWAKTLAAADADGMFYTPPATFLPLNISGLPDGTYTVNLCLASTGEQIVQDDIAFVDGQAQYEVDLALGTAIAGYIVDPPNGAVIYGVLTNA
ncbi:fibronectin type III domain-containing protein [Arsukibacterium sp.]|uniref:fibronectin type III domain-containing protein n=1 Tax=Arsukibacterium sp. TaxID=1977258 RepID=UPI00299EE1AD|nr:hypothetical protein [Arsukibacterium sp.]MDX1538814.1 hypothetical protein [Arsukibacterium sp.]